MNKFFLAVREKIQNLERRTIFILIGIIAIMCCFFFILIIFSMQADKKQSDLPIVSYELKYPIELPAEPGYTLEYKFSRKPQDKWEREEVVEYFTIPEGKNLDRLSSANEKLILDILEAAP